MTAERRSFLRCAAVSLLASTLGSVAGAIAYLLFGAGLSFGAETLLMLPVGIFLVGGVALVVAVPISLVVGAPLLWLGQAPIRRWPLIATLVLALIGMLLAVRVNGWLNSGDIEHDLWVAIMFGGLVAGAHGLVLAHREQRRWRATIARTAAALLLGGVLGLCIEDEYHNRRAASAFAGACSTALGYHLPAAPQRALLRMAGRMLVMREQGRWSVLRGNPAMLGRDSALLVQGARALTAEDIAVVPRHLWNRLGLERTASEQCLTERQDAPAPLQRRWGLVRPFRWAEVDRYSR